MAVPSALKTFTVTPDVSGFGGSMAIAWTLPDIPPTTWGILVFRRKTEQVTDAILADYFNGRLKNSELSDLGIWVIKDIPARTDVLRISDYGTLNGVTYYYRAILQDAVSLEYTPTSNVSAVVASNFYVRVVDTKALLVRALEKTLDSVRSSSNERLQAPKNVVILTSHSGVKEEDLSVVVTRSAGQNVGRTLDLMMAEYGDTQQRVIGEIDYDVFQVEWFSPSKASRRDQFTDVMRIMRLFIRHFIIKLGAPDILDVRFVMGGDSIGSLPGIAADMDRGLMTVICVIEQKIQLRLDRAAEFGSIVNTYE